MKAKEKVQKRQQAEQVKRGGVSAFYKSRKYDTDFHKNFLDLNPHYI